MYISAISSKINNTGFNKTPISLDRNSNPNFATLNVLSFKSATSAGNSLRKLKDIICPYFGVKMLTSSELTKAEYQLDKCLNVKEFVKVLRSYSRFMQPVEKKIYKQFAQVAKQDPNKTLTNILQEMYEEAIIKLKLEEFNVLDDVDKISLGLSPKCALEVHAKTTKCREVILENNQDDTFKRKTLLSSLDEIKHSRKEKEVFEKMYDRAIYLPTSGSSENAFVVKYADRSQREIAKRLLRASLATIEHVKPESKGGENSIGNFLLASANANSTRSNMPLSKFIERFPSVSRNCQKYINQIIAIINKGGLRGEETYPYKIRKTLKKEAGIELDLSEYKYTETQAKNKVKEFFQKKFNRQK